MNEWWTSHQEFVLGIVLGGLVGAAVNFIFYRLAEKPKRLGWDVVESKALDYPASTLAMKNLVLSGEKDDFTRVAHTRKRVRIGNIGKVEINGSDFPQPILMWPARGHIDGQVKVKYSHPDLVINSQMSCADNCISITPGLLNRREWLELEFVVRGPRHVEMNFDARFAGQAGPASRVDGSRAYAVLGVAVLGLLATYFICVILGSEAWWVGSSGFIGIVGLFVLSGRIPAPNLGYRWSRPITPSRP